MSRLRCHISISLDGFVAGPNQSAENPLGEGGELDQAPPAPQRATGGLMGEVVSDISMFPRPQRPPTEEGR